MSNTFVLATRPTDRVSRLLVAGSARLNYEWAYRRPGKPPFIMLTEFPRSGGNWIRDMLGDALQLSVPRFSRFPITFAGLAHNHDARVLRDQKAVYVMRDGRDVFMSHFDKTVTTWLAGSRRLQKRIAGFHPSVQAIGSSGERSAIDQVQFYEEWKRRSLGSRVNWGCHVGAWLSAKPPKVAFIRYEDMRRDPEDTLAEAAAKLSGKPIPAQTLEFAVQRNSFEAQTGRKPGQADPTSTKRQGLAGSWKTQMPDEIQTRFHADFSGVLKQAGYEA